LSRHAHHLGRRLRDDRVAAGADVRHVGFDRHDAVAVQPHPSARVHGHVVADGRGHAHADQPTPIAHLFPGFALRSRQPNCSAPVRSASTSLRCRERRSGFRIDLRVVDDAKVATGSMPSFFGHLVHRGFERHHSRRFARRPHRIALRQIEHGQPHRRHAVGAGVEQRVCS
jgi:hypothetical protein